MLNKDDIEKLKLKRQHNVNEQIIISKDRILSEAKYWRLNGISKALKILFQQKNIDFNTSILINYEQDYPGICTDAGIVLTKDKLFFEFAADFNPDRTEIEVVDLWIDITDKFEISGRKKGIGKTFGFLAIEVLQELNSEI